MYKELFRQASVMTVAKAWLEKGFVGTLNS